MASGFSESKHRKVLLTVMEKKTAFGTTNAENLLLFNNQHEAGKKLQQKGVMGSKDLTKKITKMTRQTIIPSHNCQDDALHTSSEHFPSTELNRFWRRYREWLLTDQLQVRRGKDCIS